jgi:hypothetical protein
MNLNDPIDAAQMALTISTAIDDASAKTSSPRYGWRVAPGKLGADCVASLWFKFRWVCKGSPVPGNVARLFQRGHAEENYIAKWLEATGWTVSTIDPNHKHPKFPQYRVKLFGGHLSGYLDGKVSHPQFTADIKWLLECKTMNDKNFKALVSKRSVKAVQYEHYVQMCIYMKEHELPFCLYFAINKNDDKIYVEIVPRDDDVALAKLQTAHTVIFSKARPARIAESPAFFGCKFCDFVEICHNKAPLDINCRSCQYCEAAEGGSFNCTQWNAPIPDEAALLKGCGKHLPIY